MRQAIINLLADVIVEAHRRIEAERAQKTKIHTTPVVDITGFGGPRARSTRY